MNTSRCIFVLIFLSFACVSFAQQDLVLGESVDLEKNEPISFWRPFTIELNSKVGYPKRQYGVSVEKPLKEKLFVRASFSSDLELVDYLHLHTSFFEKLKYSSGFKFTSGLLYNVFNFESINTSVRTGLEFGLRQKPEEEFYLSRVSRLVVDLPVLLQFRLLKNWSIDFGLIVSGEKYLNVGTGLDLSNGIFYDYLPASMHHNWHLGFRYTFLEYKTR